MKWAYAVIEFLKVAFSGFAVSLFGKKENRIVISKNEKTEIINNESKENSIEIKNNKESKVSGNKWH